MHDRVVVVVDAPTAALKVQSTEAGCSGDPESISHDLEAVDDIVRQAAGSLGISGDATGAITIQAAHRADPHVAIAGVFCHAHHHRMTQSVIDSNLSELAVFAHESALAGANPKFPIRGSQYAVNFMGGDAFVKAELLEALDQGER